MTTHMQSFGCFGSMLCFNKKAEPCTTCPKRTECAAEVARRRPNFLRALAGRSTASGESMAYYWLEPHEKKSLRAARKQSALKLASKQIYGDENFAEDLKQSTSERSHGIIDKLILSRVDLASATIAQVEKVDKHTAIIMRFLEDGPKTKKQVIEALTKESKQTEKSAQRTTYAVISILRACGRVTASKGKWEMKSA